MKEKVSKYPESFAQINQFVIVIDWDYCFVYVKEKSNKNVFLKTLF